jgi:hypothetical protein
MINGGCSESAHKNFNRAELVDSQISEDYVERPLIRMSAHPAKRESIRRKFSREEDDKIRNFVLQYGDREWDSIGKVLPGRTPRQCRHRYNNYLADTHQYLAWTDAEEDLILEKFREIGPKWVQISSCLPGRTGNDVKNRWHKHIVKRAFPNEQAEEDRRSSKKQTGESEVSDKPQPLEFLKIVLN